MSKDRVLSWQDLTRKADQWRAEGSRVVQCHGVFDLLHIGHIRYFQKARELGDVLIVTITPDRFVNKGPHRPVFAEGLRLEAVAALDCVDAVALNIWPTAREAITALRPAVYAKGAEFRENKTPELLLEESAAAQVGTQMAFIDELTSSSTMLINRFGGVFEEHVEEYLGQLRQRFTAADAMAFLGRLRDRHLLVVGEAMIDEYYSCATIGQSMKAPIVSTRYESHQRFASGAVAVANYLAAFVQEVDLLTVVGDQDDGNSWLEGRLRPNVRLSTVVRPDSPTIVKRRYREPYFDIPLFAVNFLNDSPLGSSQARELAGQLERLAAGVDAVVVADYGHGFLGPAAIDQLCSYPGFLAVSTQANAANFGLHTISKYSRADYFSLARRELELEYRQPGDDLEKMLRAVATRLSADSAAVTLGRQGCLAIGNGDQLCSAPALARRVVDRIGAGDAFFAVTALAVLAGAPPELFAFLGNIAAAEVVAMLGNAEQDGGASLPRSVASLLK